MSNYTPITNFTAKDALTSGNPLKAVKGADVGAELSAIATAIATKADSSSVPATTSGSFTGTLSGMTSATTGTFNYEIVGKLVTLTALAQVNGTSNASSMVLSGLPAAIQPATGAPLIVLPVLDNNGNALGQGQVTAGGTVTFGVYKTASGANPVSIGAFAANDFAASGIKGLPLGFTMTYCLD